MTDLNTPALQSIIAEMRVLADQIGKQADNVSDYSSHTTTTRLNEWAMSLHAFADKLPGAGVPTNCDEADQLLRDLRLDPIRFRSEGGWLNPGKIRAAIINPKDYDGLYLSPTEDDIDRAVEAYDDVYNGVLHNHWQAMKAALTTAPPALTAPSAEGGWRPIESAPKELTPVILWDGKERFIGFWQSSTNFSGVVSGKWVNQVRAERNPTRWQPLPEPPKEAK